MTEQPNVKQWLDIQADDVMSQSAGTCGCLALATLIAGAVIGILAYRLLFAPPTKIVIDPQTIEVIQKDARK